MSDENMIDSITASTEFNPRADAHICVAAMIQHAISNSLYCNLVVPAKRDAVKAELRKIAKAHINASERLLKNKIKNEILKFVKSKTKGASNEVKEKILVDLGLRKR